MMKPSSRGGAYPGSIADGSKWSLLSGRQTVKYGLLALLAAGLCWLSWLYGTALRDARYFDGWLLAAGMTFQLYFHFGPKFVKMPPRTLTALRRRHVMTGWVLIALFLSHTQLTLPDTAIEWILWTQFLLVSISGIIGTYLAWLAPTRMGPGDQLSISQIPQRIADLKREAYTAAKAVDNGQLAKLLPKAPHQDWINDLYENRLRNFLSGPKPRLAHLAGSRKIVKHLVGEIDTLERYLDEAGKERLRTIRELVIEKDRLDYVYTNLRATRLWLLMHVPVTYALIIMVIFHILVVYSYSSGAQ